MTIYRRGVALAFLVLPALGLLLSGLGSAAHASSPTLADPDSCYATVGNSGTHAGALIRINRTTGAGVLVGPTGILGPQGDPGVPALAINSAGEMFAMDIGTSSRLYRVDAAAGTATVIGATGLSTPTAMAFDGNNLLHVIDSAGRLHTLDTSTLQSTLIGPTGVFLKGLAFDPTDGELWGSDASGKIYKLHYLTGVASLVGNTGLAASPAIDFDRAGTLYGSSGGGFGVNNLIKINKTTGAGQVVGSIGFASVSGMDTRLDRVVPTTLQAYRAVWTGTHVEITWRLIDVEGEITFEVSRRDGPGGVFRVIQGAPPVREGDGFVFADQGTEAGRSYEYRVVVLENGRAVTSFEVTVTTPATRWSLGQSHPNPFHRTTSIPFVLERSGHVSLVVYDLQGKVIRTLIDRHMEAGPHAESWDARDAAGRFVANGICFYRLTMADRTLTGRAVLVK